MRRKGVARRSPRRRLPGKRSRSTRNSAHSAASGASAWRKACSAPPCRCGSSTKDDCIFCKIAQGKVPAKRLAEDAELLAFPDIEPQAPVHVLVIPKQHLPSLLDVKDWSLVGRMHAFALRVARDQGIADTGFRVLINSGADGVQTVGHVHLHLLGGRTMRWPPG